MPYKFTIGMPTYDDYHGIYYSIQALRMYHSEIMHETEILIIDNNPSSAHGKACEKFSHSCKDVRYIPYEKAVGPANAKDQVFRNATAPYVLCMDGHVFFEKGSLVKLLNYYKENPTTEDILQGPLVYDDLNNISTHFSPTWRGQMWGTWATDERGRDPNGPPFEIWGQGMGAFSSRKEAWLGFNELFSGFGAEEGYIHEKYRRAGKKALCLPFLRWVHRFTRPEGPKFPLTIENKARNYFIGHMENKMDVEPIIEHFSQWLKKENLEKMCEKVYEEMIEAGQKV